jgi:thermostable 8-oxoguanine DNA glycosylase
MKQNLIKAHLGSRKKVEEILQFYNMESKGSRESLEEKVNGLSVKQIKDFLNQ